MIMVVVSCLCNTNTAVLDQNKRQDLSGYSSQPYSPPSAPIIIVHGKDYVENPQYDLGYNRNRTTALSILLCHLLYLAWTFKSPCSAGARASTAPLAHLLHPPSQSSAVANKPPSLPDSQWLGWGTAQRSDKKTLKWIARNNCGYILHPVSCIGIC